jgi:hypothetical protein
MRTTIDLPDQLFRRAKTKAAMEGTSLKELITRFIEQGLGDHGQESRRNRSLRSQPPVIRSATGRPILVLSNADIEALLGQEETQRIGRE